MATYDLSHPVESGMPVYPGDPPVEVRPHATHEADGYRVSALSMGTHAGTHVDAPSHTEPDGRTLDSFSVDRFRWSARRVDCRDVGARSPIVVDDLPDPRPATDLLVLQTGCSDHWGGDRYRDHPHLDRTAAEWCAERGLDVAIDAFSVDPTPTATGAPDAGEPTGVPAHHALLGAGRLIVENLRNLSAPSSDRFAVSAYPLAVAADGAPVRAVATVE